MSANALLAKRARDVRMGRGAVGSPCVSVCSMGADGLCAGCRRTLDEIAAWSGLDDAAKRAVWLCIEQRIGMRQTA